MKVLLLFPHYNTLAQASSLRSWQIGRFLASQGHEVIVFAPGVDMRTEQPFPQLKGRLFATEIIDGVRVIRPRCIRNFRASPTRRVAFELAFALLVVIRASIIGRVDIIVASYPPALVPPFAVLLAWLKRKPLVYEVRDLMASALVATGYGDQKIVPRMGLKVEQMVARRADHIIAASPGVRTRLIERGIPAEKITAVPHGYEPRVFDVLQTASNTRQRFGWGNRFVVIYAGAVTSITDFPTLFLAAERCRNDPDVLFVIVGEGRRRQEYIEHCNRLGLENCQFLGYQPRGEIAAILAEANLGIQLFSEDYVWGYMLGSKLFDYLGAGLPVLYAGVGDAADVILASGAGRVVPPQDVDEIVAAIDDYRGDRQRTRVLGGKGRDYVLANYLGDRLMEQYESILTRTASHNRKSRAPSVAQKPHEVKRG